MPIRLSVIVCTYNPDPVVFGRCLSSISTALGRVSDAEVVVVDNNSTMPVRELPLPDVARSDAFRWVSEEVQGLTPARLRGIRESHGELLVFVDDDNFVREDFFERGIETAGKHPYIGSFSGQVFLVFEKEPPAWTIPYHGLLVRREFQSDTWSNIATLDDTMPCGAGLYVRREVAEHYLYLNDTGKRKMKLDRSGESLLSAGDNDLAACACDLGLGMGLFHGLVLEHHIPQIRLRKDYLLRLTRGIYASSVVFRAFRGRYPEPYTLKRRLLDRLRLLSIGPTQRAFFREQLRGEEEGRALLRRLEN